jgi:hypothetical protein
LKFEFKFEFEFEFENLSVSTKQVMIKARHGGPDYVFALITGYRNPPEGVIVKVLLRRQTISFPF